MNTYQKITLGEYQALREEGASKAVPIICVLTIKMRISFHYVLNLALWFLVIRRIKFGARAINLLLSFARTASASLSALPFRSVVPFVRVTAQTLSVRVFSPRMKHYCLPSTRGSRRQTRPLYGLCCSPRHWYHKIYAVLHSFGLRPSLKDPCLY
jgi:hypothetical protein